MNNYANAPFIPVKGTEASLLTMAPSPGCLYFATDTGKLFMDVYDEISGGYVHRSMGGTGAAIIYAQANTLEELPDGSLVLYQSDLEDSENTAVNVGDLIINKDGKFLRVQDISDDKFTCSLIAVSGTGDGSGGSGSVTAGTAKIEYIGSSSLTVLKDAPCALNYRLTALDAAGDPVVAKGEATWAVSNVVKHTEMVSPGENSFDIGPYLSLGSQTITLKVSINTGGETNTIVRKSWTVTSTELRVEWEHELTTVYDANDYVTVSWTPYGAALNKTAHIVVDGAWDYTQNVGTVSGIQQTYTIKDKMSHGAHTISLYTEAELNGETLRTDAITHEIIVVDATDVQAPPVIVAGSVPAEMQQYDTIYIPLVVYDSNKVGSKVGVTYLENDIEKSVQEVNNGEEFSWSYTPTQEGYKELTIISGTAKKDIAINVNKIDLGGTAEVEGYAFKLKASDFSGNSALQQWESNGVTAEFSENFDWSNGGIKSELDGKGNSRQYINIRAGDTMTIKYAPFEKNISSTIGKCIKIIFKATNCRDYDAQVLSCWDDINERGLRLGAQTAIFKSASTSIDIPYCEETYIELEIDVTNTSSAQKGFYYITSWIDGVPSGIKTFASNEAFNHNNFITIGSNDSDVQIYLIKVYEKHLNDEGHLANFIMDAPNATEMMSRFIRNDILDERGEISPTKLALKNPNCRVHCYTIPRMTTSKDDKVKNCNYVQYHGSDSATLSATGVTTRVQGTSSAAYGLAAFNMDAKFENGFDYPDGSHTDGWSMDEEAIPVNYFTTKVNVASAENANNALNQEWYNKFQPYTSPNRKRVREDGKKARDCMQFYPGVLFIEDHNTEVGYTGSEGVNNNVFKEISGYVADPYPKLYAVCNMGNSKKNTEVFHDEENHLECCIEVADNQEDVQKMISCLGLDTYNDKPIWVELDRLFDENGQDINVSYDVIDADGNVVETRTKTAYALWRNTNMSKSGFEFRYPDEFGDNEGDSFEERFPEEAKTALVGWFNFVKWMADNNPAAATNEPLDEAITFEAYSFRGDEFSSNLKGCVISDYAGTYTNDTENYRMAKMLSECEDHLVMDSVMFHYLFIERHTMIDNVAKNTFWSSGDATHWDLTKNYDNDTADGNDNQGKLSLTYGLEPGDTIDGVSVFNGPGAVWLEFTRRLAAKTDAAGYLHRALEASDKGDPWDSTAYLKAFNEWQSVIPERCWIEAYHRLYIRPKEVYGVDTFLEMLEGGKKTHQRKQYETYQNMYISSKYFGKDCQIAQLQFRPNTNNAKSYSLPMKMYADCYIRGSLGQGTGVGSINYTKRVKRGEEFNFVSPNDNLTDATGYFYPSIYYQEIGDNESDNNIKAYNPDLFNFAGATKLRKLVLGIYDGEDTIINTGLQGIGFSGNIMLEELYAAGYAGVTLGLDLTGCPNLNLLDARKSSFTAHSFATGAPLNTVYLQAPTSLTMEENNNITNFSIADYSSLTALYLTDIDRSTGVNSLSLIKNRMINNTTKALDYNLQKVIWSEDDADQITEDNGIVYLDFLLSKDAKSGGNVITPQGGLSGILTIGAEAYNSTSSDEIYNKYTILREDGKSYPNLDIVFEGENAKMPLVTIVDQSGKTVWSRRIAHDNSGLTAEFFAAGPNGAFIPFETTETQSSVFTFENAYYFNDAEEAVAADDDGYPVYSQAIMVDLVIKPHFSESIRQYTITIKDAEGQNNVYSNQFDYGTTLGSVVALITPPQKDDSALSTYFTYKCVGYTIGTNSSTIMSMEQLNQVVLRDNTILIPAYKESHVYLNPLNENYYTISSSGVFYLRNNENITLKGKITIPYKSSNGTIVTSLDTGALQNGFNQKNTSQITHIFFEPVEVVTDNEGNLISYVENNNNITLGYNAFAGCGSSVSGTTVIELPPNIIIKESSHSIGGNFKQVIFSPNTQFISSYLFSGNGYLTSVNLNELKKLTSIGDLAFNACNSLNYENSIELPLLTTLGSNAFNGGNMTNTSFYLPNNLTFGGIISTVQCKLLQFGNEDSGAANFKFSGATPSGTIWSAKDIYLYGATDGDAAYEFIENNMTGTLTAKEN